MLHVHPEAGSLGVLWASNKNNGSEQPNEPARRETGADEAEDERGRGEEKRKKRRRGGREEKKRKKKKRKKKKKRQRVRRRKGQAGPLLRNRTAGSPGRNGLVGAEGDAVAVGVGGGRRATAAYAWLFAGQACTGPFAGVGETALAGKARRGGMREIMGEAGGMGEVLGEAGGMGEVMGEARGAREKRPSSLGIAHFAAAVHGSMPCAAMPRCIRPWHNALYGCP